MRALKKVCLWIISVFMLLVSMAYFPSLTSFFALAFGIIALPVKKLQAFLAGKKIVGKLKTILLIALFILAMAVTPSEPAEDDPVATEPSTSASVETEETTLPETTTEVATEPETTAATTEVTTVPPTEATTAPTTAPTTEATTAPTTEATTAPTTEAATEATTEPPTTEATTIATTEPQEEMVWVSKTGKRYHSRASCSNMSNPSEVPISKAKARNLTPCSKCY